ncbi:BgTH12-07007 [Blumeria graminis f. sp. triticale]|uniref:protein disulfide-isomerase n=3 Tax=Blumeria graminis TaxID=34373 RepID=A0A061HCK7_BLUGR|nr:disulfide isomerase [Blumeria graminis f. sp. tritici 96224]CAD6506076.1 BgTH12-07007 [Blumeria graminis f. sp. triticale]VDB94743.1 Bgt-1296 [Blumeria graminis f. sp. tritici]
MIAPYKTFILALASASLSLASSSAVLDLIPKNFDEVIFSGKPALVEFFAPWCGHCKALAPVWEELAQDFAFAKESIIVAKVDADAEKSLGKRFKIQGFPSIRFFDGKTENPEEYTGNRDLESLTEYITKKTGIRAKKPKTAPSEIVILDDSSFKSQTGGEKHVIVAFTASWCGHCKNLAPIWEKLAQDFSQEHDVIVAKVDAEGEGSKITAKDQGVSSYPTIKFFQKGTTEPELYSGARTEAEILTFLNKKAGTHRLPGGGLDSTAGIIKSLDSFVSEFIDGSDISEIADKVSKAAQDIETNSENRFAEYYVKVFQKLEKDGEYVVRELDRLNKIIMKGGVTTQKLDEFTSKINILKRFTEKAGDKSEL